MKPLLLDLFCGAGGAAVGYARAGFDVVGVDIAPQPSYPFEFHRMDALRVLSGERDWPEGGGIADPDAYSDWAQEWRQLRLSRFDAVHASPPCQKHVKGMAAVNRALGRELSHSDLIASTRQLLRATGLPYVIENVVGAPLENYVRLCGSCFNLDVRRHRLFECSFPLLVPPCDHNRQRGDFWTSTRKKGESRRSSVAQVYGNGGEHHRWGAAMGIDWMNDVEMREAIPPAYTQFIGERLLAHVALEVAS